MSYAIRVFKDKKEFLWRYATQAMPYVFSARGSTYGC